MLRFTRPIRQRPIDRSANWVSARQRSLIMAMRLQQAGAQLTSRIQVLLEFQRDWTHHETYEAARAIVVENGGGYGMGLAYAREMIHPG